MLYARLKKLANNKNLKKLVQRPPVSSYNIGSTSFLASLRWLCSNFIYSLIIPPLLLFHNKSPFHKSQMLGYFDERAQHLGIMFSRRFV
jgi:hypothetical protein